MQLLVGKGADVSWAMFAAARAQAHAAPALVKQPPAAGAAAAARWQHTSPSVTAEPETTTGADAASRPQPVMAAAKAVLAATDAACQGPGTGTNAASIAAPPVAAAWAAALALLLRLSGGINSQGPSGNTALLWAAKRGEQGALQVLLQQGAAVEFVTAAGYTALERAVIGALHCICTARRAASAAEEAPEPAAKEHGDGQPPATAAIVTGTAAITRTRTTAAGATAAAAAAPTASSRHAAIARHLLAAGAWATGFAAICAAQAGDDELLLLLVSKGADLKAVDSARRSVLHVAVYTASGPTRCSNCWMQEQT